MVREGFSEEALLEPDPDTKKCGALRFMLTEQVRLAQEG